MIKTLKLRVSMADDFHLQTMDAEEFRMQLLADKITDPVFKRFVSKWTPRPASDLWAELRRYVFERDGYTCRYCGAHGAALECDHVVPVSRGGSNETDNLVTACRSCNRRKCNRTPKEMGWA